MSSIPLEAGDNPLHPRFMICFICGDETDGLAIGAMRKAELNGKWVYANVGKTSEAVRNLIKAGHMEHGERLHWVALEDNEKVPSAEPCESCMKKIKTERKAIAEGGIFFTCKQCGLKAILSADAPISKRVRKDTGIAAPNPVGLESEGCNIEGNIQISGCPLEKNGATTH